MTSSSRMAIPGVENNWVIYARWRNSTGKPIERLATSWTVPPVPASAIAENADQLCVVYLFNGISTERNNLADRIIQPVLQYGKNEDAGGGRYWSISSWWAGGPKDHWLKAPAQGTIPVEPGTNLTGIITQHQEPNGTFTLTSEFRGYPATKLTVPNATEAFYVDQTLEVWGQLPAPQMYPPVFRTSTRGIDIQPQAVCAKINSVIPWEIKGQTPLFGEHTTIQNNASSGGIVDLCYGIGAGGTMNGISTDGHSYEILGAGINARLFHTVPKNPGTSWPQWQDLGGAWFSTLSVISRGPNQYDVFALGPAVPPNQNQNPAQWAYFDGNQWHAPTSLGGSFKGALAAASSDPGKIDLFGIWRDVAGGSEEDGKMKHVEFVNGGWGAWKNFPMGRKFMTGPTAIVSGPGKIELFAIEESKPMKEAGGVLYHRTFEDADKPGDLIGLDQALTVPAVTQLNGELYIFAVRFFKDKREIWYKMRNADDYWLDWENLGGWDPDSTTPWAGPPVAIARPGGLMDVFALGNDNKIHRKAYVNGAWNRQWTTLGYGDTIKSNPTLTYRQNARVLEIAALNLQSQVIRKALTAANTYSPAGECVGRAGE